MKKYVLFIGIDISKHWIAVSVTTDGQKPGMPYAQFRNTSSGFAKMLKWVISQQTPSGALLFCMEHTGVYTLPLCYFLQQQGLDYILETALRIKKSLGLKRGKSDQADSRDIARYAYLFRDDLKTRQLPADTLMKLKHLLAYRARLIKHCHALKVAGKELKQYVSEELAMGIPSDTEDLVQAFQGKLRKVERQLDQLVQQDPEVKRFYELVTSVKGIGKIIALQVLVHTQCFRAFEKARQFACYIGIAPFENRSGKCLNKPAKVSHLAHKKLKALLTNGMMAAIQYDKELKAYYERKIAQGKNKYSVFNAVKNKLVSRIFATVHRGTPYVELYGYA